MEPEIIRALVKKLLDEIPFGNGGPANSHGWSYQGFGMLRLYLSKELRLHIWNGDFSVPHVSDIHDHPWDFESLVISGEIRQTRYTISKLSNHLPTHMMATIQCGAEACVLTPPEKVSLVAGSTERYVGGQSYFQRRDEIHQSRPLPGTITVIRRHFYPETEKARVFWPVNTEWVDAKPRPATEDEVASFVDIALETMT